MLFIALFLAGASTLPIPLPGPALQADPKIIVAEARASFDAGEYAKTIAILRDRTAPWESAGNDRPALDAYDLLALSYWNSGKVEDSKLAALKAQAVASRLGLAKEAIKSGAYIEIIELYKKAKALRDSEKNFAGSIPVFDQAIALARKIESPDFEAKCLRQQSINHYKLANAAAYRDLNREALALALRTKNRREEGICRNNLGIYYLESDDYSEALAQAEKALEIARAFDSPVNITDSLTTLSLIYTELGEFDKAARAQAEVLALDAPAGDSIRLGIDLNNLGIIHRRKGLISEDRRDFESAAQAFEKALAKIEKGDNPKLKAQFSNNIGTAYSQLGEFDKALASFEAALKLADQIKDYEIKSIILNNIGIVYARLGEFEKSTGYYQRAIDLALEYSGKTYLWEIYLELGNARRSQGRPQEAAEDYRAAISIIEDIRATISSEELRATYFGSDKRLDAYYNLIDMLVADDAPEAAQAAFETLEKAKARSFLDSLEVRAYMNQHPAGDLRAINREKALLNDLSRAYRKLLEPGLDGAKKAPAQAEIVRIEDELESVRREMRRADAALAALKYPSVAAFAEARAILPDARTTAVAFMIGKEKSYAFALSKSRLWVYPIPPRNILRAEVEAYIRRISDPASADFAAGAALFEELIKPALEKDTEKIIIIPDGILTYLPFEALSTQKSPIRWLVQDYEVSYAPSLSSYREIQARAARTHARSKPALLAVGAPAYPSPAKEKEAETLIQGLYPDLGIASLRLPNAGREIDQIAALFPERRRTVLSGTAATEEAFKALAPDRYRVVHFAAHGLVDDQKPMRSAIVLAPGAGPYADGLLQAREVLDLRLESDLVVLSACRTGLGRLLRGEGIEGLNRAFFAAGASAVLMTLWSVSDAAGVPLMDRFYRRLRSAESVAASLRAAKIEMIGSPAFAHPYYWAGYIAAGAADRVIFPSHKLFWILLILGTGIALVLIKKLLLARR
ncbi:MAG: CHAT domain-containing protein [Candidatus Aminicenantes bacterium]|nr:CHAT domain-containing protein [Candidatus Aminicenantes bacterium]